MRTYLFVLITRNASPDNLLSKIIMLIVILRNFFVLFYIGSVSAFGQQVVSKLVVELGPTTFPVEQPFTISITITDSDKRESITFPSITGFAKKGISTSTSVSDVNGKSITSQVVTQTYQALAPGRFRLPSFVIEANGESVRSEGATLLVRPTAKATASADEAEPNVVSDLEGYLNNKHYIKPADTTPKTIDITPTGAAFLALLSSKSTIYAGEGVALTLSLFVADNYPYALNFTALDKQLQTIIKKIRPANSWEENVSITELKPTTVLINRQKFREFRLYQSVFFPLSNQNLKLPPVSLQLARPQPKIGPPSPESELVTFTSKPLVIRVQALPAHPLRGRVPVGVFRLEEGLERQRVTAEQSVRYRFTITGEGNIATVPAPALLNETAELNVFPPEERHTITHAGSEVTGYKTFAYFMVPHQNGRISLANRFQWIYFDPQTERYDTLHPTLALQVGGKNALISEQAMAPGSTSGTDGTTNDASLYAGIDKVDSTQQPINLPALVRTIANVLILAMLVGMTYIVFTKQNGGR